MVFRNLSYQTGGGVLSTVRSYKTPPNLSFLEKTSYHLNNPGEDGGFVSVRSTLTKPPPPFFEKIQNINP
jgi:hypothetical protein